MPTEHISSCLVIHVKTPSCHCHEARSTYSPVFHSPSILIQINPTFLSRNSLVMKFSGTLKLFVLYCLSEIPDVVTKSWAYLALMCSRITVSSVPVLRVHWLTRLRWADAHRDWFAGAGWRSITYSPSSWWALVCVCLLVWSAGVFSSLLTVSGQQL